MKPIASTMTDVDNLPGEEVKFSISSANSAWVMRTMADLYSNRELACIREYSTNAYDSNKELALKTGTKVKPIEVLLPNAMNPYFEVKDSGVGMSERELKEVYTQFGESTKRESDEFNGMLGFGSKSAIAYTNTFTVTSIKDGVKTVAVVTRREDSMGGYLVTLKIILSVQTNEHSGVTIQIPVHNSREFEQKAIDFYRFWEPGTVKVNGKEPQWAVGEKIDDGLFYYPNTGNNSMSYVVMGNVPYRIVNSDALFPKGMNRISFVAYVPLGTVEFTPSREDLKYSEHTKRNLRKIITDFVDKSVDTAKKEIAAATTHSEAYKSWSKWRKVIGVGQVDDLTFKGDKLVDSFPLVGMRVDIHAYRYGTWSITKWEVQAMEQTIIVTDFDINLTTAHKKKVKDWMNATSRSAAYIIFTADKKVLSPWVDPARVVSWEQVKKEAPKPPKKPKQASVSWGRKAGSFDLISSNGRKREQDVPNTKELFYIMVSDYNRQKDLAMVLKEFSMDHEVVLLPANRKDKFLRHYSNAKDIMPYLKGKVVLDGMSLLSAEAKTYLATNPNEAERLSGMDENMVDDPKVKALIPLFKAKKEAEYLKDYGRNLRLAQVLDVAHNFKKHPWERHWERKATPVLDQYPLYAAFSTYRQTNNSKNNRHVYIYMNAVYAARKDGKIV